MTTVAGFLQHRLQHVPRLGDRVTHDGHRFLVSGSTAVGSRGSGCRCPLSWIVRFTATPKISRRMVGSAPEGHNS